MYIYMYMFILDGVDVIVNMFGFMSAYWFYLVSACVFGSRNFYACIIYASTFICAFL